MQITRFFFKLAYLAFRELFSLKILKIAILVSIFKEVRVAKLIVGKKNAKMSLFY